MSQTLELSMSPMMSMGIRGCGSSSAETIRGAGAAFPLAFLTAGTTGRVLSLRGSADAVRHIAELGFVEDAEVRVISANCGNLIIELKGTRLAIDSRMASHIIVRN